MGNVKSGRDIDSHKKKEVVHSAMFASRRKNESEENLILMHRMLVVGIEITSVMYAVSQRIMQERKERE